jgi:CRISPR-associated protein (TIGR03984 family)
MMKREIINTGATCETVDEMTSFADEPSKWLSRKMRTHKLKYLLAHADDGVIWGRLDGEDLITSHDVAPEYSPPLRVETLQTARIFTRVGELLVWRDEAGAWAGRLITEAMPGATAEWTEAFDEQQVLWGTKAESRERGFTSMSDGSQGLFHVVPLNITGHFDEQTRPLRLVVRHYLKADDYGFVRINASRLLSLLPEPEESKT